MTDTGSAEGRSPFAGGEGVSPKLFLIPLSLGKERGVVGRGKARSIPTCREGWAGRAKIDRCRTSSREGNTR